MEEQCIGYIHSLESFGSVDGPGVRYVVFLQGCRMRCQFCHNPDTWQLRDKSAKQFTPAQLIEKVERCRGYWGKKGGLTVSGGEPLLQMEFLTQLFTLAKQRGIHTCIDTAGNPFTREEPFFSQFQKLMEVTDLLLVDIKEMNPQRHKVITAFDNANILDMIRYLDEIGKPIWLRHVLVPERSDFDEDLKALRAFADTLSNVERIEVLPYHTMGVFKWEKLGIPYHLEGISSPTKERVLNAEAILGVQK